MKLKVDYKSVVVGLALGLLMAGVLGASLAQEQVSGRFQMQTNEGHAFVLDTRTGEVWEKFEGTSGGDDSADFLNPKIDPKK
jgi:hypothetical protein